MALKRDNLLYMQLKNTFDSKMENNSLERGENKTLRQENVPQPLCTPSTQN